MRVVTNIQQDAPADGQYSIRAVQRVCDILNLLQESPAGVSLIRVAEAVGLPKSSAFRYLTTLEARKYVEQDPHTGDYRLGLAFLPFQSRYLELLTMRARLHLERLRDHFEETLNLGVLDGRRVIYLLIIESPKAMRLAARPGDRDPIHCTALGKAIAAHIKERQVRDILTAEGMPALTRRTITNADEYLKTLAAVRERGYAVDDGENEPDGRCLAVPIPGYGLPAAISLSAPSSRFPHDRITDVADELMGAAHELAGELQSYSLDAVLDGKDEHVNRL